MLMRMLSAHDGGSKRDRGRTGFNVVVRDHNGGTFMKKIDISAVKGMDKRWRVIVPWNALGQPILGGGSLYNRFLGNIYRDCLRFPFKAESWDKILIKLKDDAFPHIQSKFEVGEERKWYTYNKIGSAWRKSRQRIYDKVDKDNSLLVEVVIDRCPEFLQAQSWATYVRRRRSEEGQAQCERNANNRAQQGVQYTAGSRSFAVTRSIMEEDAKVKGTETNYLDFYRQVHSKKDGKPLSQQTQEAVATMEKVWDEIEQHSQQEAESQGSRPIGVDPYESLKVIGTGDRLGRVRGLGFGALPSQVFGRRRRNFEEGQSSHSGSRQASNAAREREMTRRVDVRTARVATITARRAVLEQMSMWRSIQEIWHQQASYAIANGILPPSSPQIPTIEISDIPEEDDDYKSLHSDARQATPHDNYNNGHSSEDLNN